MNKKAFVSSELYILFTGLLVIFLVVFAFMAPRNASADEKKHLLQAKSVGDLAAWSINEVMLAGHGTTKTLYLPPTLKGSIDYNITVYPTERLVAIRWKDRQYTTPIITSRIGGNLVLSKGNNTLTNAYGGITIA